MTIKNTIIFSSGGTDISDADASVTDVVASKTFYATSGGKKTGTMVDRGTVSTDITTVDQEVTIAAGKHSGSGVVKISATEQAKIIAGNIKDGITLLGVAGNVTSSGGTYSKVVRQLTESGTWTKPTGLVFLEVVCIGGGGGGASGSKTAAGAVARAGCGGGAGCISWGAFLESQLGATEDYTVGAGSAGGASVTANSTNGNYGSGGGASIFGGTSYATSKVYANGGIGGLYNSAQSSRLSSDQKPYTNLPGLVGGISSSTGGAGTAGVTQNTSTAYQTIYGGGGGGGINTSNAQSAGASGATYYNKSGTLSSTNGGGAGGTNGGDGVNYYMNRFPFVMGTAGTPYSDVTIGFGTPGGGGGSSTSGNAGRGGDGGLYGGAGGGGGSARNDVGNSGRGGNGAQGVIILIEHIVA